MSQGSCVYASDKTGFLLNLLFKSSCITLMHSEVNRITRTQLASIPHEHQWNTYKCDACICQVKIELYRTYVQHTYIYTYILYVRIHIYVAMHTITQEIFM